MGADPLLARFADALDYPGADLVERLDACFASAAAESAEAAALLARFRTFVLATDAGRLEELYTTAFDMKEGSAPYLGAHLFGDDPRRGPFLAGLAASYRSRSFSAGSELPDHLGVVLRYLALHGGDEEGADLLALATLPAVAAMSEELGRQAHPWEPLLGALLLAVRSRAADRAGNDSPVASPPFAGGAASGRERT